MLETYEGYFEKGQFFPLVSPVNIKERRRVLVTVLDEPVTDDVEDENTNTRQATAWHEFFESVNSCDEEIPETFERVNFAREVSL